ncbi:MAG: tRNA (adenosine(37)-N6)-dimethylallyltransferase MiaA [Bacteroidetes bacterium]|nr:tRNA (adenosine(37)-N6)-dimethylallyltransferase MiaA [Bacteroidota bacterium]
MTIEKKLLIVICGPTASGKTALAIELAKFLKTEIISADSRQFYEEMKIGTAYPSEDQLAGIPHHFVGHLLVTDSYNVSRFEKDALDRLDVLFNTYPVIIMTGGSGLYIHAVCHGIDVLPDPEPQLRTELKELLAEKGIQALQEKLLNLDPIYHGTVDLNNASRLIRALEVCISTGLPYSSLRSQKPRLRPFKVLKIGLELPREELNKRINERVDLMLASGWLDEARDLYKFRDCNALNTLGYKEIFDHFAEKMRYSEAVEKIKTNTRRYAKRQMTWFRKDKEIHWFRPDDIKPILDLILNEMPDQDE